MGQWSLPQGVTSKEILQTSVQRHWGHETFREHQLEVCEDLLANRDVFLLKATGAGKSLTFQLPAVALRDVGIRCCAVIVSPLLSLMDDQVSALHNRHISACTLGGNSSRAIEQKASKGDFTLIYTTPEKLMVWIGQLQRLHEKCPIVYFAIDECHCVSEWGHEFRPEFRGLGQLRRVYFPSVPILAVTGSATIRVQHDIVKTLGFSDSYGRYISSLNRPNIFYDVRIRSTTSDIVNVIRESRQKQLLKWQEEWRITRQNEILMDLEAEENAPPVPPSYESTIIYANTKRSVEVIANELASTGLLPGLKVAFYHAGMSSSDRVAVHHAFITNEVHIVVATSAFGMGIDKANVRLVVNYGLPLSLEAYYQQTGRVGRDGLSARAVLLWNRQDITTLFTLVGPVGAQTIFAEVTSGMKDSPQSLAIAKMTEYAKGNDKISCRRRFLLDFFGEDVSDERCKASDWALFGCCDLCQRASANAEIQMQAETRVENTVSPRDTLKEIGHEVYWLLSALNDTGGVYGLTLPISILMGRRDKSVQRVIGYDSLPSFGKKLGHSAEWWKALAFQLEEEHHMVESNFHRSSGSSSFGYQRYSVSDEGYAFLLRPLLSQTSCNEDEYMDAVRRKTSELGSYRRMMGIPAYDRGYHTLSVRLSNELWSQHEVETRGHAPLVPRNLSLPQVHLDADQRAARLIAVSSLRKAAQDAEEIAQAAAMSELVELDPAVQLEKHLENVLRQVRGDLAMMTGLKLEEICTSDDLVILLRELPMAGSEIMSILGWPLWKQGIADKLSEAVVSCIFGLNTKEEPIVEI